MCLYDDHCLADWQPGDCMAWQKSKHCDFVGHYRCDKCQTLLDCTTSWTLCIQTTYSDIDPISKSEQYQSFNWKFYVLTWLSWDFIGLLSTSSRSWMCNLFWHSHIFKGDNWLISSFEKNYVCFFSDTLKARSFKLCMIMTVLGVYIVILGFMALTLFSYHRCIRSINCKLSVLGHAQYDFYWPYF